MNLHLTFRNMEATDALKEHLEKRTEKFEKFVTYPIEVHVRLQVDRPYHTAEITCHAEHQELVALAQTKDLYEAIDLAVHKMESQLKKRREKRKGHTAAHLVKRPKALKVADDVGALLPHREKKARG